MFTKIIVLFLEQRHLTDTQMRLGDNSEVQRNLNEAAFHAETDLKSKQMKQNIEVSKPLYNILPKLAQPSEDNGWV